MSSNTSDAVETFNVVNRVKFILFLSIQIPSLICSLYIFIQYISCSILRSIHHDVVIVLLCSSFLFVCIPVSASKAFFYTSIVRPGSDLFCSIWTWIHYSCNIANLILMTFACIERHWLIFHPNPLKNSKMRILYHYIPIGICIFYPIVFYFILIFFYPCESVYDYSELLCIMPCYFLSNTIGNVDTFLNNWTPIFIILLLSGSLFLRFVYQKRRMRMEIVQWKRDRKLIVQLLSIVFLYVCVWRPLKGVSIYNIIWTVTRPSQFQIDYLFIFPYLIHLLYPFIVLFSNSEVRKRNEVRVR